MAIETWPDDRGSGIVVRAYTGNSQDAILAAFQRDAELFSRQGYEPAGQHYVEGSYGCGYILIALLMCLFFVGIPVVAYMLLGPRPAGTLVVTYAHVERSR